MKRFGIPFLAILACFAIIPPTAALPIACSMEAKMCPDGSAVSRTGPDCEFAPCPKPSSPGSGAEGGAGMAPWTPTDPNCESGPCVTPGSDSQTGKIEGRIVLSPASPLAQYGVPNQRPIAGEISITDENGDVAAQIKSDGDGRFQADLPPGHYVVHFVGAAAPASSKPQPVTIESGKTAKIMVVLDTGIR